MPGDSRRYAQKNADYTTARISCLWTTIIRGSRLKLGLFHFD